VSVGNLQFPLGLFGKSGGRLQSKQNSMYKGKGLKRDAKLGMSGTGFFPGASDMSSRLGDMHQLPEH